jgi:hypothetical protein
VLVHKLVIERMLFLAEEVDVVPLSHEGAAEVLDVDVAPRPGEHVSVRHEELHARQNTRAPPLTREPRIARFRVKSAASL